MKLRLFWIFTSIAIVCSIVFYPHPAIATPTQCGIYKNNGWRCAKDNYQADTIIISNETIRPVTFKVGIWTSTCGKKGSEISNQSLSVESRRKAIAIPLIEAKANQCVEMFVYDCSPDVCTKVLSAHSN